MYTRTVHVIYGKVMFHSRIVPVAENLSTNRMTAVSSYSIIALRINSRLLYGSFDLIVDIKLLNEPALKVLRVLQKLQVTYNA